MSSFARQFLDDSRAVLARVDEGRIEAVAATIAATRDRGGRLFLCGSGGGAGHASHAAADFRKLTGIESYSVTDNVSELTARVNDDGWESSYARWLEVSRVNRNDCLFVFSVGGGDRERGVSPNLVEAMELAAEREAAIVGIAGRDGGELARVATAYVLIPTVDPALVTPQAEGFQALIWHLLVSHPLLAASPPKWESMTGTSSQGTSA